MTRLQQTPLHAVYKEYGGKTINFGGWDLPVQFSGIRSEHEAVRTRAGLFDVSHMGQLMVTGTDSLSFLQKMMTNDVSKLKPGKVQYTAMCTEDGGTVDDLLIYQLSVNHYLLVVNAINTTKDFQWLQKHMEGAVEVEDVSSEYALLAIQGPLAVQVVAQLATDSIANIGKFHFKQDLLFAGKKVLLSRTGYTGEDGFEIYCHPEDAVFLWKAILAAGEGLGIVPCGLGARDTLRFEACFVLYGQEISASISPLEAGIEFAVRLNKQANFIGKKALQQQKEQGIPRTLVGIEMLERGIPRNGYPVHLDEKEIGMVTTGTQSPTLKKNIGLALITTQHATLGKELTVEIRRKRLKAKIIPTPFYPIV